MRLIEVLICIVIVGICSSTCFDVIIDGHKSVVRTETSLKEISEVIEIDLGLRKEIREITIPYWKRLINEEKNIEQVIQQYAEKYHIKITAIETVFNKEYFSEYIKIKWEYNEKEYFTREYLRQRIINERK